MSKPKVLRSVNNADGSLCVDIFQRADGSFGFEEYRRDPEDPRGWYPVADHSALSFDDRPAATSAAVGAVPWFKG